ncbi:hypothetical protein [Aquisphaera insulae]|uniref:hypothetical protein n=1 Tax=Aquisphaera insulae TaxID=2712864 RepID=UPI0013EA5B2E|nr:hypothetical protein [Aquisphaera insulae]
MWLNGPKDASLLSDAKAALAPWADRIDLLEIAARRETCDWAFPLDEQRTNAIDIALYDIESLRTWGSVIALKAHVEIAEGRFVDAERTLETGFAFGRHVGAGPFMINALVGMAIERSMLDRVDEWVQKPGSPNLYWALTALPHPLVSVREAMEQERLLPENMVPELGDAEAPRSPGAWTLLVESMYRRMRQLSERTAPSAELKESLPADLGEYKRQHLETFRKQLVASGSYTDETVRTISDDEVTARAIVLGYRTQWDTAFKAIYLPFPDGNHFQPELDGAYQVAKRGPFAVFSWFLPSLWSARIAETRLDRQVAQLRIVEAIRLHAAAHGGSLPKSLDEVREVPLPVDPSTGGSFSLKEDGDRLLIAPLKAGVMFQPDYAVTLRKAR